MALVQDFYSVVNFYLTLQGKQVEIDNYTLHHANSSLTINMRANAPSFTIYHKFFQT